jgi:hypothetical protein
MVYNQKRFCGIHVGNLHIRLRGGTNPGKELFDQSWRNAGNYLVISSLFFSGIVSPEYFMSHASSFPWVSYGCMRRIQVHGIGLKVGNYPGFLLILRSPRWHSMTFLFDDQEPIARNRPGYGWRGALLFVRSPASPGKVPYGHHKFLHRFSVRRSGDFDRSTAASGAFQSITIYPRKSTVVKIMSGGCYTCLL